jgi:hypothetical protein
MHKPFWGHQGGESATLPDGRIVERYYAGQGHFKLANDGMEEVLPPPQVWCQCGNNTFQIGYGDYECIARCVACGREGEVYSG